jgi:hypothetical protein
MELALLLKEGTYALRQGYRRLSDEPGRADENADAARKAERSSEKVYRRALGELFNEERYLEVLGKHVEDTTVTAVTLVIEIFKHREIYRHLSNAADRLARAGEVLHDIVVKIS